MPPLDRLKDLTTEELRDRGTEEHPLAALGEKVLWDQLHRAAETAMTLQVPRLRDHVVEHPGFHFHFNPDFIIGLEGSSRFEFIHEHFVVAPGTAALIPGGIPHREIPLAPRQGVFRNLAISIYNETISVQLQEGLRGEGVARTITDYYDTPKHQQLAQYLDEIAELSHSPELEHRLGIKGLLLIYLSTLESVIKQVQHSKPVEKLKVSRAKRLVQEHLGNSELGVAFLATLLHCSSDYLSNLFHRETGQRLATHINTERIKTAMTMLRTTPLTIAEVAYAVGFESQGYFSRVFKQITLKNPMAYRRSIEHSVIELEGRPQTIFAGSGPD